MKNAYFFAGSLLSLLLTTGQLYAQDSTSRADLVTIPPVEPISSTRLSSAESLVSGNAATKFTARASKDLRSRFTKVTNEQWSSTNKGFCAYFTSNGIINRVYYDSRGRWQGSLKYCDEFQLPYPIRDVVKRTYYDFAITVAITVEVPGHIAYIVHLEDKNTLKIVRVDQDGEMDVLDNFIKSK